MYFDKRGENYGFLYYDSTLKRTVRLPRVQAPAIANDEEAKAFCKAFDAKNDSFKYRCQKRMEWREKFTDFEKLLEIFEIAKKIEAPNCFDDYLNNIRFYVFPFFLGVKNLNNIATWDYHFEEFRDYLRTKEAVRGSGKKVLSYSTVNNIINSMNSFFQVMQRYHYIEKMISCRQYPKHLLNRSGEEAVIQPEVASLIHGSLAFRRKISADFFWVCLHSGVRMNEGMGLSIADFHLKSHDSAFLAKALEPHGLTPIGYITLESQPSQRTKPRDAKGHVPRKPLKGKKKIDPDNIRIIPIIDRKAFNILAKLWNEARARFKSRTYGDDMRDYLLFEGLTNMIYSNDLRKVQEKMKLKEPHSAHHTRHTYSTWLVDKTAGNFMLTRLILGHHDLDMTLRYVHLNAKLKREIETKTQLADSIDLISEG